MARPHTVNAAFRTPREGSPLPDTVPTEARERQHGGGLNAAISNRVVQIQREYVGRGPTKARTFVNGNLVVTVLEDALTKAE